MSEETKTFDTTDIDLAAFLHSYGWTVKHIESTERGNHKRFCFVPCEGDDVRAVVASFDSMVEVVPRELYAARSAVIKLMHRFSY